MNILQFVIDIAAKGDKLVTTKVDSLQKKIYQTDVAANKLAMTIGGKLRLALDSLPGAEFFMQPMVLLAAGTAAVAKMGMEAEKTAVSFNLLAGSQEKGAKALAEMNRYADDTIWDRKDIQAAGNAMLNYQIPVEKVVDDLKRLGDVAAGDKNKLSTLATVFGQINSLGKLQTQDWKQLINVGYNPLIEISQMTGKSMAVLSKELSDGTITMDMVRQALIRATSEGGRYYRMTEKLAETSAGAFERMKGSVSRSILEMYNILSPVLVPLFDSIAAVFDNVIVPAIQATTNVFTAFYGVIQTCLPAVAGLTAAFAAYTAVAVINTSVLKGWNILQLAHYGILLMVEKAQWLWNAALTANPIGLIIAGVVGLTAALAVCWKKFAGFRAVILTVWDTVKGFAKIIKDSLVARLQNLVQGLGKVGEALFKLFKGDFSGAWESAKSAGVLLSGVERRRQSMTATRGLITGMGDTYRNNLEAARAAIGKPKGAAGVDENTPAAAAAGAGATETQMAGEITAGGTRNTSITLNIGKFWEDINVFPAEDMDMNTISRKVLEAINRSLEAATSAAR
ncbi:MAG: hypothetical protein E7112_00800 [Bacteroidales bacterium]|nr:hypothetical protein [Bacteroidales bacterium]